jgi:hypothetical protein
MRDKVVVFSDIHADIPFGWKQKIETLVRPNWQGADMVILMVILSIGHQIISLTKLLRWLTILIKYVVKMGLRLYVPELFTRMLNH